MKKRIIVMGGAGFLGSHLCEKLIALGDEVIAIDDLSTGSRANVEHLFRYRRFSLLEHDVTTPFHLPADAVYNLACPASPPHYQASPVKTTLTSVLGSLHALELVRRSGGRLLLASTSEVYGDPEVHPQPETYRGNVNPIGIRSCYDEGKRCAESLAMDYHRSWGVDVRIARIFNTYGPRMRPDDGRVVSNFVVQALRGEDLTVYGDGSQTRSFCYVADMVDGLMRLMDHPNTVGPINLGNPDEFTVRELAEQVKELTGSRSTIRYLPLPADDPKLRKPQTSRAERELGFWPKIKLRDGLLQTITHFRRVLEPAEPKIEAGHADAARADRANNGDKAGGIHHTAYRRVIFEQNSANSSMRRGGLV